MYPHHRHSTPSFLQKYTVQYQYPNAVDESAIQYQVRGSFCWEGFG